MAISAQSLFHFTSRAENLISILQNGFYPCYSLEGKKIKYFDEEGVPMVSFCDLPLSKVTDHIAFYGNYGIGLNKDWAERNGLNPVLYLSKTSTFCECLEAIFNNDINMYAFLKKSLKEGSASKADMDDYLNKYSHFNFLLVDFVKPILGTMYRDGKYIEKVFYDEREWRYIPKFEIDFEAWHLDKEDFESKITLAQLNSKIAKTHALKFNIDDVKYIIVSSENDIYSMIQAINDIYKAENDKKRQMLCSRILTVKQIKEDF